MSGTGYDLSTAIYSPDGRVFQVEYALKAVDTAETVLGVRCRDGIILACEKIRQSPLETSRKNSRIHNVETHIGLAICGSRTDGEYVLGQARQECEGYRRNFGVPITGAILAERLANFVHAHTLYMSYRPLGCSVLLASADTGRLGLFLIENSGVVRGYYGCSAGKGKQTAKTGIEKIPAGATVREALPFVAKAIAAAHEEFKEKTYELEMSTVSDEHNYAHVKVEFAECERLRRAVEAELEEAE